MSPWFREENGNVSTNSLSDLPISDPFSLSTCVSGLFFNVAPENQHNDTAPSSLPASLVLSFQIQPKVQSMWSEMFRSCVSQFLVSPVYIREKGLWINNRSKEVDSGERKEADRVLLFEERKEKREKSCAQQFTHRTWLSSRVSVRSMDGFYWKTLLLYSSAQEEGLEAEGDFNLQSTSFLWLC